MRLEISGRAIVGSKEPQQDSWRVFNARGEDVSQKARSSAVVTGDGTLVLVADGIGGYAGGEIASRVACDAFASIFFRREGPIPDRLSQALEAANTAIADEKRRNPDLQEMGCTFIGVHFQQDRMTFVSVGDSLLLRSREDEIHRVNLDHSYFDYLDRQVLGSADPGRWSIAVSDARRRASLTLAMTGGDLNSSEFGHRPQIAMRPLLADDIIIVASDGIETLDWVQLQNFLKHLRPNGIMGIADGLIGAVDGIGKNRTYQDNTTIVVVGASSGAGLTRVAMSSQAVDASPPAGAELVSRFAWLRLLSNTQLLFGSIIVAVMLIVALLLWPRGSGVSDVPTITKSAPVTNDKAQPRSRQGSSDTPQPEHVDLNQPGGQQQAATTPQPPQPPQTPAPVQSAAPNHNAEIANAPPVEPQAQVPPPQVQHAGDRDAQIVDPDTPKIEVRPRTELNDVKWVGSPKSVSPANNGGECRQVCNDNPQCVAYTWRGDNQGREFRCEMFSSVYRLENSPKSQSGAREWDNYAWVGAPTQSQPADSKLACFRACLDLSQCGGYTYSPAERRCDVYPANSEPAPRKGSLSGKLRQAVQPRRAIQPGD